MCTITTSRSNTLSLPLLFLFLIIQFIFGCTDTEINQNADDSFSIYIVPMEKNVKGTINFLLFNGEDQSFEAFAVYGSGQTRNITSDVEWRSANQDMIKSLGDGLFQAVASSGSSTISASYQGKNSNTFLLSASASQLVSLQHTPANFVLAVGNQQNLEVTASYSDR